MTSDIGSDLLGQNIRGKQLAAARDQILRKHFRPEFLNRLDPLATEILPGKLRPGSKVVADLGKDSDGEPQLTLRPAAWGQILDPVAGAYKGPASGVLGV